MSDRTDYLVDLLQELDEHYSIIRLHHEGGSVHLDDLGNSCFEVMAHIASTSHNPKLVMSTKLPCAQAVVIYLQAQDSGLWDVRVETGAPGVELRIDEILGRLKRIYGLPTEQE